MLHSTVREIIKNHYGVKNVEESEIKHIFETKVGELYGYDGHNRFIVAFRPKFVDLSDFDLELKRVRYKQGCYRRRPGLKPVRHWTSEMYKH